MYFATGMLWNQALQPLQVMSTAPSPPNSLPYPCRPIGSASFASCDYDAATPGGERVFGFDWVAPVTGNFLVSVRTFLREGAANGNYSMAYGSDWVDLCVTQSVSCGAHGTCEMIEDPPGVYAPKCECTERWRGDQCNVPPPDPVFLTLSGSTTIAGSIQPDKFSVAVASLVPDLQPWSITVGRFPQRLSAAVAIPGDLRDFDTTTAAGIKGNAHFIRAVANLFNQVYPPSCTGPNPGGTKGEYSPPAHKTRSACTPGERHP